MPAQDYLVGQGVHFVRARPSADLGSSGRKVGTAVMIPYATIAMVSFAACKIHQYHADKSSGLHIKGDLNKTLHTRYSIVIVNMSYLDPRDISCKVYEAKDPFF